MNAMLDFINGLSRVKRNAKITKLKFLPIVGFERTTIIFGHIIHCTTGFDWKRVFKGKCYTCAIYI